MSFRLMTLCALVTLSSVGVAESPSGERALRWYRGNTHTHTLNSDGDSTPDVVARWYRENGYQFVFITDHEYLTDVAPLNAMLGAQDKFLVLSGQEVTQWSDDPTRKQARVSELNGAGAHVNALFATQLVWPIGERRCGGPGCGASAPANMPLGDTFMINVNAIRASGALAQINHPNLLWAGKPQDLANVPDGALIEVWNGAGAIINNLGGDDGTGDIRPSAEGFWDWALSRGKLMWAVASDDSHTFREPAVHDSNRASPGKAWIVVRAAALSAANLKQAISRGDFYASNGVALEDVASDGKSLTVRVRPESMSLSAWPSPRYSTRFVGRNDETLAVLSGVKAVYRFKGSESYVRAVITDSNGKKAWTQPVFLDARKDRSAYGSVDGNGAGYHVLEGLAEDCTGRGVINSCP